MQWCVRNLDPIIIYSASEPLFGPKESIGLVHSDRRTVLGTWEHAIIFSDSLELQ